MEKRLIRKSQYCPRVSMKKLSGKTLDEAFEYLRGYKDSDTEQMVLRFNYVDDRYLDLVEYRLESDSEYKARVDHEAKEDARIYSYQIQKRLSEHLLAGGSIREFELDELQRLSSEYGWPQRKEDGFSKMFGFNA